MMLVETRGFVGIDIQLGIQQEVYIGGMIILVTLNVLQGSLICIAWSVCTILFVTSESDRRVRLGKGSWCGRLFLIQVKPYLIEY
jgi:hypothetical protein